MKSLIKKLFFGIDHPQEYICAKAGDVENALDCFIITHNKKIKVKDELLFLGYSPLVFAWTTEEKIQSAGIHVVLQHNGKQLAELALETQQEILTEGKSLFIFKGISSKQHFEPAFHQMMFRWYDRFRTKHTGNINLDPELYNQLKIAYSIPREIKLITLGNGNAWNVFPTDLHGPAGKNHYIISLRHAKKACQQVQETGKLALWTMHGENAKEIYALGKNHSRDLSGDKAYFTSQASPLYHFPEPRGALSVSELELEKVIGDYGIHRLLLFKIVSGAANENPERLMHLHRSYMQWHIKNGFKFTEVKR